MLLHRPVSKFAFLHAGGPTRPLLPAFTSVTVQHRVFTGNLGMAFMIVGLSDPLYELHMSNKVREAL